MTLAAENANSVQVCYGEVDVDVDIHASNAWVHCVFGNVDIKLHWLDLAFDFSKITVRV